MKFETLKNEPVVVATLPAKTATDRRIMLLNNAELMVAMLRGEGYSIVPYGHLRYAEGLKCPHEGCGATWNTLDATPALRYVTPGGDVAYPSNPRYLSCTVCVGPAIRNAELFRALFPTHQAKNLDKFSITKLHLADHIAVRSGDRTAVSPNNFQEAARLVATNQPSLKSDFSAVLVRTCGVDVAKQALTFTEFPFEAFVNVPLTHDLWPTARWHSQPMNATDTSGIAAHARRQRRETAKAVEDEVAQFRAELSARQGA